MKTLTILICFFILSTYPILALGKTNPSNYSSQILNVIDNILQEEQLLHNKIVRENNIPRAIKLANEFNILDIQISRLNHILYGGITATEAIIDLGTVLSSLQVLSKSVDYIQQRKLGEICDQIIEIMDSIEGSSCKCYQRRK